MKRTSPRRDGLTGFVCALVAARHTTARAETRLHAIATRLAPARNRQTPSQNERSNA